MAAKRFRCALAVLTCGFWSLPSESRSEALSLTWSDVRELVSDSDLARQEIASVLEEVGFSVRWDGERPASSAAPALEAVIVISPSDPKGPGWNLPGEVMGVYLKTDRATAVFVFHRRVAAALRLSREGRLAAPSERRMLARAIARVAIHELIHRLCPSLPHAGEGLFQTHLGASLLARTSLPLDDHTRSGVRSLLESPSTKLRP